VNFRHVHFWRSGIVPGVLLLSVGGAIASPDKPGPSASAPFADSVLPFLVRNCHGCHSAKASTAGLNLDAFENGATIEKNRDR
jgi:hypothetical protein